MKILDIPQSGKRGLNVSQNGRFGEISRALVIPGNPQTLSQRTVRAHLSICAQNWAKLTEEQRAAWTAAAKTQNAKARCGTTGALTGNNLFTKDGWQDVWDSPPADGQSLYVRRLGFFTAAAVATFDAATAQFTTDNPGVSVLPWSYLWKWKPRPSYAPE